MTTTDTGGRLTPQAELAPPKTGAGPFVRLPHEVVRDTRLDAVGLVYVAYRATFVGEFSVHAAALRSRPIVRGYGFGRDAIERARRQARDAGYLQRRQQPPGPNGQFRYAVERLSLPPCGASGKAGKIVCRDWFDGALSVKEMAAYLYLRAGSGKGPTTYAKELKERFSWSLPTARQTIAALIEFGLVARSQQCAGNGHMRSVAYEALSPALWSTSGDRKKPGHGAPGLGSSGHILTIPLYALPSEEPSLHTSKLEKYASRQRAAPTATSEEDIEAVAFGSIRLLGWLEADGLHDVLFDYGVGGDGLRAITGVADDDDLRQRVRVAADRRVHDEILSPAGLLGIRILAAFVLAEDGENLTADAALSRVLNAIRDRIGSRTNAWLNSLGLIGKRLLCPASAGNGVDEHLYGAGVSPKKIAPRTAQSLAILKQADGARILASNLYRKPEELEALLGEYGADALRTIKAVLTGAMINVSKVGQVRSWEYFRGPLEDERCNTKPAAAGMRPGDCAGWRYANRNGGTKDD